MTNYRFEIILINFLFNLPLQSRFYPSPGPLSDHFTSHTSSPCPHPTTCYLPHPTACTSIDFPTPWGLKFHISVICTISIWNQHRGSRWSEAWACILDRPNVIDCITSSQAHRLCMLALSVFMTSNSAFVLAEWWQEFQTRINLAKAVPSSWSSWNQHDAWVLRNITSWIQVDHNIWAVQKNDDRWYNSFPFIYEVKILSRQSYIILQLCIPFWNWFVLFFVKLVGFAWNLLCFYQEDHLETTNAWIHDTWYAFEK